MGRRVESADGLATIEILARRMPAGTPALLGSLQGGYCGTIIRARKEELRSLRARTPRASTAHGAPNGAVRRRIR